MPSRNRESIRGETAPKSESGTSAVRLYTVKAEQHECAVSKKPEFSFATKANP